MRLTWRKPVACDAVMAYGESPDRSRLQNALVLVVIAAAGLIFLGFVVASDPAAHVPAAAAPLPAHAAPTRPGLLSLADQSHNDRMRAMRDVLEARGYWIDGRKPICTDPRGAIDGMHDLIATEGEGVQLKWRLAAARFESARPQSFVLARRHGRPFSTDMADALAAEWAAVGALPEETIAAGRELLHKIVILYQRDTAHSTHPLTQEEAAYVKRREWQRSSSPVERAIYLVELQQVTAEYHLEAELLDIQQDGEEPPSSQLVLDFRWQGSTVTP